jgi:flavin reductase (DIM6/NTAB) family NADH-FMN oxidoreductase RutF
VGFSSNGRKGTVANAEATREFTRNVATRPVAEPMNATSTPEDIDEFEAAALEAGASLEVKAPRVAAAPICQESP